jgi:hypothetical protein|tara:strand:+ start:302 stop:637 length:336 start_codon:yes stop_codon:yes gene_type:complete
MEEDRLIDMVERVVDDAMFKHIHTFRMRDYLEGNDFTKKVVTDFLKSGSANNIKCTCDDLDLLIEGGHSDVREAYPNWNVPEARKFRNYLNSIITDAEQYAVKKSRKTRSK